MCSVQYCTCGARTGELGEGKKNDMALAGSMCAIFAPLRHIRIVYFADYFLGSRAMLLS